MDIREDILEYEKLHSINDTELAFDVHISVERIHAIKNNASVATEEEIRRIRDFINTHK